MLVINYSITLFIGYFIRLHFKYYSLHYPLSQFALYKPHPLLLLLLLLLWGCSPNHPPTPTSPPWHPPTLGHWAFTGPRASPPIDAQQGHPLLHMQLEPCVLLGWWFSPWELWGIWLVDIVVLPEGVQTPSAPSAPQSFPYLLHWGPCAQSNGCLQASASVFAKLWQSLSGDNYIRLLSASTSWHPQ